MEDRNDAPAFPVTAGNQVYATGLTLRDWFAGNIVANMFAYVQGAKDEDEAAMMCARIAYKTADAMLEARK